MTHLELDQRLDELEEGGDLLVDHLGDDCLERHAHARHRQIFLRNEQGTKRIRKLKPALKKRQHRHPGFFSRTEQ